MRDIRNVPLVIPWNDSDISYGRPRFRGPFPLASGRLGDEETESATTAEELRCLLVDVRA